MHLKGEYKVSVTTCFCSSFSVSALGLLKLLSATKAAQLITLPHVMNDKRQRKVDGKQKNIHHFSSIPFSKAWPLDMKTLRVM